MIEQTIITLAPGQKSFYDAATNINLSLSYKRAVVPKGSPVDGLIRAVKAGKIRVVSGSLGSGTFLLNEKKEADKMAHIVSRPIIAVAREQHGEDTFVSVNASKHQEPEMTEEIKVTQNIILEEIVEIEEPISVEEIVLTEEEVAAIEIVEEVKPKTGKKKGKKAVELEE